LSEEEFIEKLLLEVKGHTPWLWQGSIWETEGQYVNWLRSQFRSIWSDWVLKNDYQMQHKIDIPKLDEKGNQTFYKTGKRKGKPVTYKGYICEQTGKILKASKPKGQRYADYNVDHIDPAGSCTTVPEALIYFIRLLTSQDNMQIIDTEFHKVISHYDKYKDKYGFKSFNDASAHKQMIAESKTSKSQNSFLKKKGITPEKNADLRKMQIFEYLRFHKDELLIRKDGYLED
tara:strand:+ start:298 stop:990 length:693 start_codon:yes stop_codon:yes gene_type:complete